MHQEITTVGLDLAKSVFQVPAISANGKVVRRRQLRRAEVPRFFAGLRSCLVGMEARLRALLGSRAHGAWARSTTDAGVLRKTIRKAWKDCTPF
jgi:hypothetical protein